MPKDNPLVHKGLMTNWPHHNTFRHCKHIGVDPDQHLLESGPTDFETWLDWILRTTKKKTHETISQMWKGLCQSYSILVQQPTDSFITEQMRRVRPVPLFTRD